MAVGRLQQGPDKQLLRDVCAESLAMEEEYREIAGATKATVLAGEKATMRTVALPVQHPSVSSINCMEGGGRIRATTAIKKGAMSP